MNTVIEGHKKCAESHCDHDTGQNLCRVFIRCLHIEIITFQTEFIYINKLPFSQSNSQLIRPNDRMIGNNAGGCVSEENRNSDRARQAETSDRYLAFQVGGEPYAIPLLQVKEVIEMSEPMPLPHSPSYFKGVINLRGQVICVLDLRLKLNFTNITNGPKTAIIILDIDAKASIGVIVDRINSVVAFHNEDISTGDSMGSMRNQFITGVARRDNKMTLILDVRAALSIQDLHTAQQAIDQEKAS